MEISPKSRKLCPILCNSLENRRMCEVATCALLLSALAYMPTDTVVMLLVECLVLFLLYLTTLSVAQTTRRPVLFRKRD
jgi:hypothetical protein